MTPETEAELAEMIAGANGPLRISGGGTRSIGYSEGAALSIAKMDGITLYEPGALTIVTKTGTPLAEIEAVLAAENQRLAFEPMDHRALLGTSGAPTIGGMVAANVSGPRRIAVGACRDFALGVRFVDGAGSIVKNGGRVMKNVTGYDLVKLMCGSYGTLGVLTEVSLKVLPDVEAVATLVWNDAGWTASSKIFNRALGSPFEVTGAARLPTSRNEPDEVSKTLIRIEGFEKSVQYRVRELLKLFDDLSPSSVETNAQRNHDLWERIRNVAPLAKRPGNVWRTSVKPSDMNKITGKSEYDHVVDWGGGLIWTLTPEGTDLRSEIGDFSGHCTLIRGSADAPSFQPEPAPLAAISAGLRAKFDPRGILNPGLMS